MRDQTPKPRRRRIRPWQIPLDGRPLSRQEIAEARAVKIALLLCVAVLKNETFTTGCSPMPHDLFDGPNTWLRRHLRPLASHARILRDVAAILDESCRTPWDDPQHLRQAVRRLYRQAHGLPRRRGDRRRAGEQVDPPFP